MLDAVLGALAWVHQWSDPLAWVTLAAFVAGAAVDRFDRERARYLTVGAWVAFGVFWLSQIYHFVFVQKSIVEGIGTLLAVPLSLSVGLLLARGRDSLFVLSRAVAIMGLVFLPFEALAVFRRPLVEAVTDQTAFLISLLGIEPTVVEGMTYTTPDGHAVPINDKTYPYESTFAFTPDGHPVLYTIKIACTGVGSMAIFAGLIGAVRAPLSGKLRALAVSLPVIYALNLVRNVFISVSFGKQYLHVFPETVMGLFATDDPYMVSYFVADRILAQSLSVVALIGITWLVVRELPAVLLIVEDVLYVVTRTEYDLVDSLGLDAGRPVRADGEGPDA
ncbi:archaeosortase A [Halobacteriales archaeon QS_1_68_17]|nr:MAG: archaeosortase A [Halobacteriales archaeon QS_1_68_17]